VPPKSDPEELGLSHPPIGSFSKAAIGPWMGAGSSILGADGEWGETSLGDMPESCVAAVLLYLDPPEICQVARLNRAFRGAASADCVWAVKLPANYRYLAALAAAADDEGGGDGDGNGKRFSLAATKKEIYARLCRPTLFEAGTKVTHLIFRLWRYYACLLGLSADHLLSYSYEELDAVLFLAFCLLKLCVVLKRHSCCRLQEFWILKNKGGLCISISSKAMTITGIDDRRYWSHLATEESRYPFLYLRMLFCISYL